MTTSKFDTDVLKSPANNMSHGNDYHLKFKDPVFLKESNQHMSRHRPRLYKDFLTF